MGRNGKGGDGTERRRVTASCEVARTVLGVSCGASRKGARVRRGSTACRVRLHRRARERTVRREGWNVSEGMNRRDFLKYSVATGVLIAAGDRAVGRATASEPVKVTEVDKLTIWVLADNYFETNLAEGRNTKRYRVVPGKSIHAEHGLSFFIETVVDGKTSACMFDYGLDASGVLNNIALLGIDVGKVASFSLSHGHYDHFSNAIGIIKQVQSRLPAGTRFYVGEEAFAHRYSLRPGTTEPADLGQLRRSDLEGLGLDVVEVRAPTQIIPGGFFTGNIERLTPYEKVPPTFLIQRGEKPEPDDFRGEQGLLFHVKGKGLVVLSGCAHAGIVNTVRQAQKVSGVERLHAIMGGFHLSNAKPELIQRTVADLKAVKPEQIVPTHCTGFDAIVACSREMPEAFTLNTVGTRYTFGA
jgi:7,8-dihydropterin-6-yl-methyl-4-(beta-D-ribofuranosyl)aminobenzene 5'-phosphate synthase